MITYHSSLKKMKSKLPDLKFERSFEGVIAGVDEAGCAPFAGPVVAAAVILPIWKRKPVNLSGLNDSKQLTSEQREVLYQAIIRSTVYGVGIASVEEIDRLNIYQANMLAMRRAVANLSLKPDVALIDGNRDPKLSCPVKLIIKGDTLSLSIAAASIIAKVTRDRMMKDLACQYPGYGWENNAGYGTDEHYLGLLRLGPTPHHRNSFAPVVKFSDSLGLRARLRFKAVSTALLDKFHLIQLRTDLYAVFNAEDHHIGVLKAIRRNWFFKSIAYSQEGHVHEGEGPYAFFHNRNIVEPCGKVLLESFRAYQA
jgi:ribonuclease HII